MYVAGKVASASTTLSSSTSSGLYFVKNSDTDKDSHSDVGTVVLVSIAMLEVCDVES